MQAIAIRQVMLNVIGSPPDHRALVGHAPQRVAPIPAIGESRASAGDRAGPIGRPGQAV
jgi:hypothetical protein